MIDFTYRDLYNQDSVDKQISIVFDGGELTNTDLYSESFELEESICSENELVFGSCEASMIKFKIANNVDSLKGKWLTVSEILDGKAEEPFQFGKYKVYSDVPSGDRNYRNITAYDSMYDIINADVSDWYNTLEFPMTQKTFRDSFFKYLGIAQEEVALIHDELELEKTISGTGISGKTIISAICELNGVFGHINRSGDFAYISLATEFTETIEIEYCVSCEYEDFNTSIISKLQIRQGESDVGTIVGEGTNCYIIDNNFLVYGKATEEMESIANITFEKIKNISYTPFKAEVKGNPCFEVGDAIVLQTRNKEINSYILERTLSGIQSLKDSIESKGTYEYKEKVNSLKKDIQQIKGKTNVLERNLESTRSEITDIEAGLNTKIEQNTETINASVQRIETSTNEAIESVNGDIETLTKKVEATMTAEDVKLEIQSELDNGVDKVTTSTGFTFDDVGLTVSKSDSEMSTQITEDGMAVRKNDETVLTANSNGVDATNLHATTYLIIGENSRFEDYGNRRTGCFYIGGGA